VYKRRLFKVFERWSWPERLVSERMGRRTRERIWKYERSWIRKMKGRERFRG